MDAGRQDPIAAIEDAVIALRHARGGRRMHGGPPWAAGGAPPWADRQAHLEHMPMVRGHRGPHVPGLGGAARFRMLGALHHSDGMSVSEIAEAVGVDQPRASRLVNEAAERGLVDRRPDERDARRSVVRLTASGRAMLDQANQTRRDAVTRALDGFTADETETFAALFTRFVESWRRDE
jgi:DNA-binding MarR family transcriptional regulator